MNLLNQNIIPYEGLESIKFLSSLDEVKKILKDNNDDYKEEYQSNKGCNPGVPWKILHVNNCITLIFAKDKLWEIYIEEGFKGTLVNGIGIGIDIEQAKRIDSSLNYNDLEEFYESKNGYWLENSIDDGKVMSITIYIKEVENEEEFFKYDWVNNLSPKK